MTIKEIHQRTKLRHFDDLKRMSNYQLEFAWLGSIFLNPEYCREFGLLGLDSSMFREPTYFDLGLLLLHENFINYEELPDEILIQLMNHKLISQIVWADDKMHLRPFLYKQYANEIENRIQKRPHAEWI